MDYTNVFTEKEANNLLIKCMLEYDVGHFSFKPRLIFQNYCSNMQTRHLDYGTEDRLLDIYNAEINSVHADSGWKPVHIPKVLNFPKSAGGLQQLLINHRSNYYIDLESLLKPRPLSEAIRLKSTKIYEAIVTLMLATTHYDSIVPHLKWLNSQERFTPYTEVVNQYKLQTQVDTKSVINATVFRDYSNSVPIVLTVPLSHATDFPAGCSFKDFESTVKYAFTEYLIFGLELMNRIESIPDENIRTLLYDMFYTPSQNEISKLLYCEDSYGKVRPCVDISHIVSEKDMEKRYYAIRDFVESHTREVDKATSDYLDKNICINEMFGVFIRYCQNESILNIRKKTIIILYTCLKNNKIDIGHTSDPDSIPIPGDFISGDDAVSSETEAMMNDAFVDYGEGSPSTETEDTSRRKPDDPSSISFEELDKLTTSFKDNGYSFEVSQAVDNTLEAKAKYDEIAKNMSLLNANLIRSIKEIKVYNTGGKNPGKSAGKLDRKNLYKYKHTKDIFFDNTYKVKESDLAFGIILDVSGSMSGNGIKYGKATMVVLHETLKALNINHSIITHTSHRKHHCVIKKYQSFKEDKTYSCEKNYALSTIRAESGNCDSASLYYMEQLMRRVKNKDKICIIFSDGEPTECTDTELIEQVRHMENKGIRVIGVGIDFPKIKEYYKNNANGRNLKEMFNIVSNILKEYVLEKIDKE